MAGGMAMVEMHVGGGPTAQPPLVRRFSVRLVALNEKMTWVRPHGGGVTPDRQLGSESSNISNAVRLPLPLMFQLTL